MSKPDRGPGGPVGLDEESTSDEQLVGRAQRGERRALEVLVRRHQRAVFRLCLRYVRDADEAADLAQRTFMRAMAKLGELRSAELFRSWLLRTAANLALNHLRDHARFVPEEAAAARTQVAHAEGTQRLEAGETAAALQRAVEGLATRQRMTLELRIHEELSFRQIAEALGTTEGAAKVNFHYAVKNLRARIGAGRPGRGDGGGEGQSEGDDE